MQCIRLFLTRASLALHACPPAGIVEDKHCDISGEGIHQYDIDIFLQIQYRAWTSSLPETADTAADDGLAGEDERISRANGCVNTTIIEKEPASTK